MAYRFGDSFDHYATAQLAKKYSSVSSGAIASTSGRSGGGCWSNSGGPSWIQQSFAPTNTWIIGAAFKFSVLAAVPFIKILDNTSTQVDLRLTAAGELEVTRNGTQLAITLGLGLVADRWYFIEFKATIGDSGSYAVRVNGIAVAALTRSGDTQATVWALANNIQIAGSVLLTIYADDLYICDDAGAVNNNFLGDCRQAAVRPDSAGNYSQWTPSAGANYQCVDEATPNDDTDYVETTTAPNKDSYGFGAVGVPGTIKGVQICIDMRKTDAGTRQVRPFVRIGGVDYFGDTVSLSDTFGILRYIWEMNPATSPLSAWTVADIDAAEFGVELVA